MSKFPHFPVSVSVGSQMTSVQLGRVQFYTVENILIRVQDENESYHLDGINIKRYFPYLRTENSRAVGGNELRFQLASLLGKECIDTFDPYITQVMSGNE